MMDDRAELQLRAEILELRARIDLMASQQQAGGDSVIPSVPRQAGRMTLQTACSWDIIKRDGQKIWIRPGLVVSVPDDQPDPLYQDMSISLEGDGTDVTGDGYTVINSTSFNLNARITFGSVPTLELYSTTDSYAGGSRTVRDFPLYRLKYDATANLITVIQRYQYSNIYTFVPQFVLNWDSEEKQHLVHLADGRFAYENV
jgi:hypothetical protein